MKWSKHIIFTEKLLSIEKMVITLKQIDILQICRICCIYKIEFNSQNKNSMKNISIFSNGIIKKTKFQLEWHNSKSYISIRYLFQVSYFSVDFYVRQYRLKLAVLLIFVHPHSLVRKAWTISYVAIKKVAL